MSFNGSRTGSLCAGKTVLELTVQNHAGVMAAVSGRFAARGFNVEGILCMPVGDSGLSRIWLMVNEEDSLEQVVNQLANMVDVVSIERHGATHELFEELERFFAQ